MNTHETENLTRLLAQLGSVRAGQKDVEAEALIDDACSRQPDAAYLLVQRVLLLENALQDAQTRLAARQAELDRLQSPPRAGFLDANYWGNAAGSGAAVDARAPAAAVPAWGSGLLGNIAATAAGVVAGSFLFQGLEHLTGDHGASWSGGGGHQALATGHSGADAGDGLDAAALADLDAFSGADDPV